MRISLFLVLSSEEKIRMYWKTDVTGKIRSEIQCTSVEAFFIYFFSHKPAYY